jgi:predicted CxxxxCH...CXXCH cytochrome family protein
MRTVIAAGTLLLTLMGCGSMSNNNPQSTRNATACNSCHNFPGSAICQKNVVSVNGIDRTHCSDCHLGSIALDSASVNGTLQRFDAMLQGDSAYPRTAARHTNGRLDVEFGQCYRCHSSPPADQPNAMLPAGVTLTGDHAWHVGQQSRQCIECHFSSIASTKTYSVDGPETTVVFQQKTATALDGSTIPVVDSIHHLNKSVDVVFKRKNQYLPPRPGTDTLFVWNAAERSCSNVTCHGGPGDNLYQKAYWGKQGVTP